MSEWISVEDRLPECETQVIAATLGTGEQMSIDREYCPIIFAAIDPDNDYIWYDWSSEDDIDNRYFKITHWMPLPEPPSDEGDDYE